MRQERIEHRGVAGLAGGERDDQRAALSIDELVDLGRHPAAGATECMIGWLGAQVLVVRFSPLCGDQSGATVFARIANNVSTARPSQAVGGPAMGRGRMRIAVYSSMGLAWLLCWAMARRNSTFSTSRLVDSSVEVPYIRLAESLTIVVRVPGST